MEDLTEIFGDFSLSDEKNEFISYSYLDLFKNPNKLPINNVFIEQSRFELNKNTKDKWKEVPKKDSKRNKIQKKEVLPALHASWIPEHVITFEYHPYNFNAPEEDNTWFIENNENYVVFLSHLIRCTYHQFWCTVLFKEDVQNSLRDFLLDPIPIYLYRELGKDFQNTYKKIFNALYMVIRRLIFFKQSETEFMPKSVGAKYLLERKLLNLPIATTITLLYQDFDAELIDELGDIYFNCDGQQKIIEKEIEYILKHSIVVLEMIRGKITGDVDPGISIVPICIEERPKVFDLNWIESVVNYLLNTISTLEALFRLQKKTVSTAFQMKIPEKLAKLYDLIFDEVYNLLEDRDELKDQRDLTLRIIYKIGLARSKFVTTFHTSITYLLDEIICRQQNPKEQQDYLEIFINTMAATLEYEIFVCDYNYEHDVSQTIEILQDVSKIDKTRVEYIITSLNNLERREFLKQRFSFESTFFNNLPKPESSEESDDNTDGEACVASGEDGIELKINTILGIFPHLGDGFVEKCLAHYDFDADQVIQAILEENLPPHIIDIPMDLPRIPPEPEPPKPILAYRGKKPEYDDALKLLNDKKEKDKMKTLIMDGIQYNNRYDNSDDEYDDTLDDVGPDFVVEYDIERYDKPNEEDLVSDTSYSDNEFDDEGQIVEKTGFKPFCEDPAVVRARYEARFGARRGRSNVVGAPKGQGQEKKVVQARQKKNVQKSTRANHNRKGGSQFKRNRGMVPS